MKKTIISIIGIAVMLLAITACRPNYVIVPIPGGGTPSGTPVADLGELKAVLAKGGEARLEDNMQVSAADLAALEAGTINGDGNKIIVTDTTTASGTKSGLYLKGVSVKDAIIDVSTATRASVIYDDTTYAVMIQGEGTTLENVEIITGGKAGINVHSASNVMLKNVTIDDCAKAPVSISSSTVTIDGITAKGSDWYGTDNVIQVNGVGGNPKHQASTIIFKSVGNINKVWVEAVENTYDPTSGIKDSDFEGPEQTKIDGLNWTIRFSNQPSKGTKGWMYYKDATEATTFTINSDEKAKERVADELRAMLDVIKEGSKRGVYSTIQLGQDIELDSQLDITIPVTIDGSNKYTISLKTVPSGAAVSEKSALFIKSSDVHLKNLTVSGPDTKPGSEAINWDEGEYAIKAYGATGTEGLLKNIVLDGVTIQNANAGMLVRGAAVELKGNIVLNTLGFGGFGVDSGDSKAYSCVLTVAEGGNISGNLNGVPAIWTEHGNDSDANETVNVNGSGVKDRIHHTTSDTKPKNQYWYSLTTDTSSNN